ncbi:MAG: hypothetical protein LC733_08755 [Actinobacteria bacterium]|nr:hypothetical protein [Actinomycetota bacterium]
MQQRKRLNEFADELTRRLGIPFVVAGNGAITFRDRLRVTDWAVPLMFDGHVARDHDSLVPTDFVGHLLWPALQASRSGRNERPWWSCTLSPRTAAALVEALQEEDEAIDDSGTWVIGRDVLLDDMVHAVEPLPKQRRRVA